MKAINLFILFLLISTSIIAQNEDVRFYLGYDDPIVGSNYYFHVSFPINREISLGGGLKFHKNNHIEKYQEIGGPLTNWLYSRNKVWEKLGGQVSIRWSFLKEHICKIIEPTLLIEVGYWHYRWASADGNEITYVSDEAFPSLDLIIAIEPNISINNFLVLNPGFGLNLIQIFSPVPKKYSGYGDFYWKVGLIYRIQSEE